MSQRTASRFAPWVLLLMVLSSGLTMGCQTIKDNPKAATGAGVGAATGGAIAAIAGANPAWIVFSVLAGGLLGGFIGKKLDDRDKEMAARAAHNAFESNATGQPSVWENPDTGHSGSITPTRTYQLENGQYCREYVQKIYVDGEQHDTTGTACRQADGSWKVQ